MEKELRCCPLHHPKQHSFHHADWDQADRRVSRSGQPGPQHKVSLQPKYWLFLGKEMHVQGLNTNKSCCYLVSSAEVQQFSSGDVKYLFICPPPCWQASMFTKVHWDRTMVVSGWLVQLMQRSYLVIYQSSQTGDMEFSRCSIACKNRNQWFPKKKSQRRGLLYTEFQDPNAEKP